MQNLRSKVAGMVLAASTLVGIAAHEGYKEAAYIPIPGDVPTIGFGHTEGVRMGDKTNPVRSLQVLLKEIDDIYVEGVKRCVTAPLYQYEFSALVSLAYNIGVKAFCGSTVVKRLNALDYQGACDAFLMWNKAGGIVVQGLVNRREEEKKICEGRYE